MYFFQAASFSRPVISNTKWNLRMCLLSRVPVTLTWTNPHTLACRHPLAGLEEAEPQVQGEGRVLSPARRGGRGEASLYLCSPLFGFPPLLLPQSDARGRLQAFRWERDPWLLSLTSLFWIHFNLCLHKVNEAPRDKINHLSLTTITL